MTEETFEDPVNKQMLKEMREANRDWIRAQKLTDLLWQQKRDAEAPFVEYCIEIGGFRERRALRFHQTLARSRLRHPLRLRVYRVDRKHLTLEELLEGKPAVSLINEPATPELPRETATERAMRPWFTSPRAEVRRSALRGN
jgi:hypothetical protein